MPPTRPYLKFLIAGGVVCAEGGSMLPAGLEIFVMMSGIGSNILRSMAITFIAIGAVSLCIGLSLLYKGVTERNLWLGTHHGTRYATGAGTFLDEEVPMQRAPLYVNTPRRFCAACGNPLPNLSNIKFCPKCGQDIR